MSITVTTEMTGRIAAGYLNIIIAINIEMVGILESIIAEIAAGIATPYLLESLLHHPATVMWI